MMEHHSNVLSPSSQIPSVQPTFLPRIFLRSRFGCHRHSGLWLDLGQELSPWEIFLEAIEVIMIQWFITSESLTIWGVQRTFLCFCRRRGGRKSWNWISWAVQACNPHQSTSSQPFFAGPKDKSVLAALELEQAETWIKVLNFWHSHRRVYIDLFRHV